MCLYVRFHQIHTVTTHLGHALEDAHILERVIFRAFCKAPSSHRSPTSPATGAHASFPLTQDLQQHALAAIAQGVAGHTLVRAPVVCRVSISDLKAPVGTLRVQREPISTSFQLLLLGSQPEDLNRWCAPLESTAQPGLFSLQH